MPQNDYPLPSNLPRGLLDLFQHAPLPGIDGGPQCKATGLQIETLLEQYPKLRGSLTEAAIWLLAGELNRSHEVSQNLDTFEGSYWHGIMHRREGDFWNAKYWFRKVGVHPAMEQLSQYLVENSSEFAMSSLPMRDLSSPTKMSSSLVDSCQRALSSHPEQVNALQRICWLEWQFLFLYGWDKMTRQIKL